MFDFQAKLDRTGASGRSFVVVAVALAAMAVVALACAASAQAHQLRPGLRSAAPSQRALSQALAQSTGLSPSQVTSQDICPVAKPGYARCAGQALVLRSTQTLVRPYARPHGTLGRVKPAFTPGFAAPATASSSAPPLPGTPAYLQQAYDLAYLSQTAGGSDTVAIVDAYSNANAESDLAVYRSTYGLPACTTANGCFKKVNQTGGSTPPSTHDAGWAVEESLDLDAVSALCPNCHILLVEANSASSSDLAVAQSTAASLGATQISDSWTIPVSGGILGGKWVFNGISTVAATGDTGYLGTSKDNFPAAFYGVTAAGGTSLAPASGGDARGFSEGAWSFDGTAGGGSGCDPRVSKPSYQTATGCTGRAYADLSADADPATGLHFYDSEKGGWGVIGGTSLSAPLIAAYYAITGVTASSTPRWAYDNSASLNDPVTGSTGTCDPNIRYICNAGPGYDGPTGIGSISGTVATGAPGIGGPANASGSTASYTQSTRTHGATLEGGIYPNGLQTKWWIEYGTDASYGQQTFQTDAGTGSSPVAVTGYLSHLTANTTYHYRLVAQNSKGTTYGYDYTFTTPASSPTDPTAAFNAPTAVTPNSVATFNAAASGDGTPDDTISNYTWDWGDRTTYSGQSATATHTYSTTGVYNVTLIVTDANGRRDSTNQTITVDDPKALFTMPHTFPGSPVAFDARGSTDPQATISSYTWDFGDGTTAGPTPNPTISHVYAGGGTYTVILTITNSLGQTASTSQSVTVDTAPTASFTVPSGAQAPNTALSFDARASTDPAGWITAYSWDFGDGSAGAGATASHAYQTPGHYTITLTVTNHAGQTATANRSITVDAAPSASISISPSAARTGATVALNAGSSSDTVGTITAYAWNFGDGTTASGLTTSHVYTRPGSYVVALTVTNDAGQSATSTQTVSVYAAPYAAFSVAPATALSGAAVNFNAGGSSNPGGAITGYNWNFGDGATTNGLTASHAYLRPGTYTVTLTVTGSLGLASRATHTVTVVPPPLNARLSGHGRQKLATVLKHGVGVRVSTNTAATASFVVTMPGRRVGKARASTVLRTSALRFALGTHSASLKLSRGTAAKLRSARKPVVLTLRMTLTDAYGRKAIRSVKVTVAR